MKCKTWLFAIVLVLAGSACGQSIEALMNNGQELLRSGAFAQAVSAFRKVLSQDPRNFEAQHNLAFAYLQMGRNQDAATEFQKAVGLNGKSAETWANLAIAYENMGNSGKALSALDRAAALDPSNSTVRMNLAALYYNAGQQANAIAQYKQVIAVDGRNVDALNNLAKCLLEKGDDASAKKYLSDAIAVEPQNGQAHWELGNIHWKKEKNTDQALKEYRIAVSLNPNSQVFYENLGLLYEELGKKEDALDTWKKYIAYLDDALMKEKIQRKIDKLEGRGGDEQIPKMEAGTNQKQIEELKRDVRGDGQKTETRIYNTAPVDVGGSFEDLQKDEPEKIDLREEAKKRAAK